MMSYQEFLRQKQRTVQPQGIEVEAGAIHPLLFAWQRECVLWALRLGKAALFQECGLGKCHGIDTPILMYDGSVKAVQDVKAGDLLMGPDSQPRIVLSTSQGWGELYRIIPKKGESWVCNAAHVLSLQCGGRRSVCGHHKGDVVNIPLTRYLQEGSHFRNFMKLWRVGVDWPEQTIPLEPYMLGLWIGDGNENGPAITKADVDAPLCEYMTAWAAQHGFCIRKSPGHNTNTWHFTFGAANNKPDSNWLKTILATCMVNGEKRIPRQYLVNSRKIRLELLAALIDSDGALSDGCYDFTTKYKGLADDVCWLARSLGFGVTRSTQTKRIKSSGFEGQYERITISGHTDQIPVLLERKKAQARAQIKDALRVGFSVEPLGEGDYYGFTLSGDGLYLLGDFTVTHNTLQQLEWARHVAAHTGGKVLIVAPLAVAHQTVAEGRKIDLAVRYVRSQEASDAAPESVLITNYDMLKAFDANQFVGVVLDESSILKAFTGATKRMILSMFEFTPYKLACTATPAPNDHLELGNHADFLNVMASNEMISRWFINDSMQAGNYRLKRHAEQDFWRWVTSWAVCISKPSDLGYPDEGFALPPLVLHSDVVAVDHTRAQEAGMLFLMDSPSATLMWREKRATAKDRCDRARAIIGNSAEPWIVWCDTNQEADILRGLLPEAAEVRGSDSIKDKEERLSAFSESRVRVIITKPDIAGFGLNWQHCHNQVFVGVTYSFEKTYQALRRSWRFGQTQPVHAWMVYAESEGNIMKTLDDKREAHKQMQDSMNEAMRENGLIRDGDARLSLVTAASVSESGENWTLVLGDCIEETRRIDDSSIDFSIFSPPFSTLYIYSDSVADMGNNADDVEFFRHFDFLIPELYRITQPGRLCAIHCKDLPLYMNRDGAAGLRDFPGHIIQAFERHGWVYHSRVTIWKDPVIEMQRTKNHGLLYKNFQVRSEVCRQGMADYVIVLRKWGGVEGSQSTTPVLHDRHEWPLDVWQRYASPVWMDIDQTNVLNYQLARDERDEKHICPLQLDVIQRCIDLWTNPGELVFSPFAGVGSEGVVAIKTKRRFLGIELKESYWRTACGYLRQAEQEARTPDLFTWSEASS